VLQAHKEQGFGKAARPSLQNAGVAGVAGSDAASEGCSSIFELITSVDVDDALKHVECGQAVPPSKKLWQIVHRKLRSERSE
jgi:hypothetical protein